MIRICKSLLLASILLCLSACSASAQSLWEVTPYKIRVWWVLGNEPDLPDAWRLDFGSQVERNLNVIFRAVGQTTVEAAPKELRIALRAGVNNVTRERLFETYPELAKEDKLFLVHVEGKRLGYRLQVREFDTRLAHFGPTMDEQVDVLAQVPGRVSQIITTAFSPMVRIDRFSDGVVKTRLRAGALLHASSTVGKLQPGDLLLPFDRRVSGTGRTSLKSIRPINWTYLLVPKDAATSSITMLEVVSGYKQPFRSKRNRKHQQLALRTSPAFKTSTIRLQTKAGDPLIGYELHETGTGTSTDFLGYTDWRGEFEIAATQSPIRTLLVRSGDRVIAKLPIVPGLQDEVVASMVDNRKRVETDGFLSGVQNALVDLVAMRESLTVRIRRLIASGDLDRAEGLLEEFRDLPNQTDFQRDIQQQQRALNVTDANLRKQIDTMFVETYQLLGKYLDVSRLRKLEDELAAAKAK